MWILTISVCFLKSFPHCSIIRYRNIPIIIIMSPTKCLYVKLHTNFMWFNYLYRAVNLCIYIFVCVNVHAAWGKVRTKHFPFSIFRFPFSIFHPKPNLKKPRCTLWGPTLSTHNANLTLRWLASHSVRHFPPKQR